MEGMVRAENFHGLLEDLLKLKIDRTGRSVVVDVGKEIKPRVENMARASIPRLSRINPSFP